MIDFPADGHVAQEAEQEDSDEADQPIGAVAGEFGVEVEFGKALAVFLFRRGRFGLVEPDRRLQRVETFRRQGSAGGGRREFGSINLRMA